MTCKTSQEQQSEQKKLTSDPKSASQDKGCRWLHNIQIPILYINYERVK